MTTIEPPKSSGLPGSARVADDARIRTRKCFRSPRGTADRGRSFNHSGRSAGIKEKNRQQVITRPTSEQIRLIDEEGGQLGILDVASALELAQERDLDLVELDPNSEPPTCKLMNFGKYKYNLAKRQKGSKKSVNKRKEVKLRPKTEQHDFDVKLRRAKKFLEEGHKVLVTLIFRGREQKHPEIGFDLL
ncbi:MAG: translation initiation factor IF-3, partial [Planctomycetes bacterium]|nr:translation initiation factor IF-3 [Planctomycetota bacterium]